MQIRPGLISTVAVLGALVLGPRLAAAATDFNVTNSGASAYVIGGVNNPTLTLTRGQSYTFTVSASGHPFWITTARGAASAAANAFAPGVSGNGAAPGVVTFAVPSSAPGTLFYQCSIHDPMGGTLTIVSPAVPSSSAIGLSVLGALLLASAAAILWRRRVRA